MTTTKVATLLEAVQKLNSLEEDYREQRRLVADLFIEASKTHQLAGLARLAGMNRTTVYWLMNTWGTRNENGSSRD